MKQTGPNNKPPTILMVLVTVWFGALLVLGIIISMLVFASAGNTADEGGISSGEVASISALILGPLLAGGLALVPASRAHYRRLVALFMVTFLPLLFFYLPK